MLRALVLASLLLGSQTGVAATYYVDFATGSDANAGTSTGAPWRSIPGSRTTNQAGYLSAAWGAIDGLTTNTRIKCGDTILLKGGVSGGTNTYSTATVPNAGGWCIAGTSFDSVGCAAATPARNFYTTGCSKASPITITIASNAQWTGSQGNVTVDCATMTPKGNAYASDVSNPCVSIGGLSGLVFGGISATQRLEILNTQGTTAQSCGLIAANKEGVGTDSDLNFAWLNLHDNAGCGMALGDVAQVLVNDVELHHNGTAGFNCGMQIHHNCNGVALQRANVHDNVTSGARCATFGDAVEIQGSQELFVLDSDVHDNGCSGMNMGSADHVYPWRNHDLVRNTVFRHNGTIANLGSASAGYQGGGDSVPLDGYAPSPFDAYGMLERVIFYNNMGRNFFLHHGSGFTVCANCTSLAANTAPFGSPAVTPQGNNSFAREAADNVWMNSIWMKNVTSGGGSPPLIEWESNSLTPHVCRQGCSNPGAVCTTDADCTACTGTNLVKCGNYQPIPVMNHNLYVPNAANTETVVNWKYTCDVGCTNGGASGTGAQCAASSGCTGCSGGCEFTAGGGTFASPPLFIQDANSCFGTACDPQFIGYPATCRSGADYSTCNLMPSALGPAVDVGAYYLKATAGSGTSTITVAQADNTVSEGVNFNGWLADPSLWFIAPSSYLNAPGDTIQIKGATCGGSGETAVITGFLTSPYRVTLDRSCTFAGTPGIALPWNGNAPDAGAIETGGVATTTTTTPPTTSTSTSTTSTSTSSSTSTTSATPTTTSTSTTSTTLASRGSPRVHSRWRFRGTRLR